MKELNARIDAVLALESKVTRGALVEIHAAPPVQEFCMVAPEMAAIIREQKAQIETMTGVLRQIAAGKRNTLEVRLALSCVSFLDECSSTEATKIQACRQEDRAAGERQLD